MFDPNSRIAAAVAVFWLILGGASYGQMPFAKACSDGSVSSDFILEPTRYTVPGVQFFAGDFNGDGLTDFFVYRASDGLFAKWYSSDSGPCSPEFLYRDVRYTYPNAQVSVGDFNGDGLSDVLIYHPDDGAFVKFYADPRLEAFYSPDFIYQVARVTVPHAEMHLGDFNGDGMTDVLVYRPSDGLFAKWYSGANVSPDFFYQQVRHGFDSGQVVTGDWNGDGLTDVLLYDKNRGGLNGWFQKWYSTPVIGPDFTYLPVQDTIPDGEVFTGDFNGDGLTDIFIYRWWDGLSAKWYSGSYGPGFLYQEIRWVSPLARIVTGDFDGDGITDVLFLGTDISRFPTLLGFFEKWYDQPEITPDFNRQPRVYPHYRVLAVGDFNGDRATDLLVEVTR